MENSILTPLIYSAIAGSATLLGFALTLYAKGWVKKYSYAIVSLAAGVLLGTAFFHLLPEASEMLGEDVFLWLLVGFVAFFLIEALIGFHACREGEEHCHAHVLGPVAGAGLFFHSLLDGVTIAVSHEIDPRLGLMTAIAVFVHELPEGIFTFSILKHGKMEFAKAKKMTVAVALATPFGTLITLLFAPELSEHVLGILLGVAAGSFLYISASDLVPESHKSRSIKISLFLVLGLLIVYFL
ncbi:ZIP family metal transporter [Candidatus Peregrinibacteria bacterium]|jgi:zinc and cadmium transporter|nr:ZIP family metal transporter [Candidatus Peregrinibacteria bacterium]MBT4632249.1 ZIP family metal transporter [Candidatus Peregrinibacteria bacterium]MBT5516645.1 ZIP family metal transporter [Candidatus Peregrinibacteria bacterium]MBT5824340.1 ZIP family metal transporter [Candidatus Peregrinibacteria bacterium]